ncbi:MAG: FmdB family transcriptional regulator [Acidobacteriota bacterium]|nr:FmdB family transcriptional regulator [Acidobacteriota bacterium]
MPIYEYERADGTTFEIYQAFDDEALTQDPETGASVRRVFHAPAVHFKGKGFYNTDYGTRKRQRESAAQDGSGSGAESASKSDPGGGGDATKSGEPAAKDASGTSAASGGDAKGAKGSGAAKGGSSTKKREPVSAG